MINKRSEDIVHNMRIDDLKGFVCFIPSVIVGEPMTRNMARMIRMELKSIDPRDHEGTAWNQ